MTSKADIIITSYEPQFAPFFRDLNLEWIEQYFRVEEQDVKVLEQPDKNIIQKGGAIFMALEGAIPIGAVAMLKIDDQTVELGKMAVSSQHQGKGIGKKLMDRSLLYARTEAFKSVILYSNTILTAAMQLYNKYGFVEVPLESNSHYERSNIKMELVLDSQSG